MVLFSWNSNYVCVRLSFFVLLYLVYFSLYMYGKRMFFLVIIRIVKLVSVNKRL